MKAIICGVWTYENQITADIIDRGIDESGFYIDEVVIGDSSENSLGEMWAKMNLVPVRKFPINWGDLEGCKTPKKNSWGKMYNPQAGFIRNQKMIDYADAVIAVWDGINKEAEDFIKKANEKKKPVHWLKPTTEYFIHIEENDFDNDNKKRELKITKSKS